MMLAMICLPQRTNTSSCSIAASTPVPSARQCMVVRALLFGGMLILFNGMLPLVAVADQPPLSAPLQHALVVTLSPDARMLEVVDTIQLPQTGLGDLFEGEEGIFTLRLARHASVKTVTLQLGDAPPTPLEFTKEGTRLFIDPLDDIDELAPMAGGVLELRYDCSFADPVEKAPANMDNPGFGVDGVIDPEGAMLLAGSGWHPMSHAPGGDAFTITIQAPRGMYAVTTGTLLAFSDTGTHSHSKWQNPSPHAPLPLAAGWWEIAEKTVDGVRILTCFGKENAPLSQRYLDAAGKWVQFYQDLHGPYAFDQFLVVENFLPTGYGFPGFTLLGRTVIRLPFIPDVSLRHEVAHSWWGNGVLVDYSQGNWCEGLTTYVADYLGQEEQTAEAGRDYRLRTLRRYALLAAGPDDFPLARFASRMNPASQAIGYGKSMFVFHMMRQAIGDAPFWTALRALYAEKLFQPAGWEDLRQAFVTHGCWDAEESRLFMEQWVARPGAPQLSLQDVNQEETGSGWQLQGTIKQSGPVFDVDLPMIITTAPGDGDAGSTVTTQAPTLPVRGETPFALKDMPLPLQTVRFDPDAHVFRLLAPEEIPATVDTLKGSSRLMAVVSTRMAASRQFLLRGLQGLSQPRARIVDESSLQEIDVKAHLHRDVFFFGQPTTPLGKRLLDMGALFAEHGITMETDGFAWDKRPGIQAADVLFLVESKTDARGARGLLAMRAGVSDMAVARPAALLTHYGRYSYLAFEDGQAVEKGAWEPGDGPLVHHFTP